MTEAEIIQDIRAEFLPSASAALDLTGVRFGGQFDFSNSGPSGVRRRQVLEALAHASAVDRYEAPGLVTVLTLTSVVSPFPHVLFVHLAEHPGGPMIYAARRLHGSVPQDPTRALAQIIARHGHMVSLGGERALFFASREIAAGDPGPTVDDMSEPFVLSCMTAARPGRRAVYRWVYAIREEPIRREEAQQRSTAQRTGTSVRYGAPFDRLSDRAIVVRGGSMRTSDLEKAAKTCHAAHGFFGFSTVACDAPGYEDVLARAPQPHRVVRWAEAGQLRDAGLELRKTGGEHHYSLVVPDPTPTTLDQISAMFSPPVANPTPKVI